MRAKIIEHKEREVIAHFKEGFVQANEVEPSHFRIRLCIYRPYNSNDATPIDKQTEPYEENISISELEIMRDAISDFLIKFSEIEIIKT